MLKQEAYLSGTRKFTRLWLTREFSTSNYNDGVEKILYRIGNTVDEENIKKLAELTGCSVHELAIEDNQFIELMKSFGYNEQK